MTERLSRLHELELRVARGRGQRPNYSESELTYMEPKIRDKMLEIPIKTSRHPGPQRKTPTQVYRFYSQNGALLYVGLSMRVAQRVAQHRKSSWWDQVARIEIETCPDRDAASVREKELIATLHPSYNRNRGGA